MTRGNEINKQKIHCFAAPLGAAFTLSKTQQQSENKNTDILIFLVDY